VCGTGMTEGSIQSGTNARWGLLAEYDSPGAILRAAAAVRRAGYTRFDVYTPYPVHGMDQAMGLGRSRVGWIVAAGALAGGLTGLLLQVYVNWDFPLIHQAKPYQSWPAWVIVTFELTILFSAFAAVIGMFMVNGLPRWYHPVLKSKAFDRASDNRFFLTVEAADERFDADATRKLLDDSGAISVETLEE